MVMQKVLKSRRSFSVLANMVSITLMYYVDFYSQFNNPEKEWEIILSDASDAPLIPSQIPFQKIKVRWRGIVTPSIAVGVCTSQLDMKRACQKMSPPSIFQEVGLI